MTYVRHSVVQKLFQDMIDYRGKAVENNKLANAVTQSYVTRWSQGDSRFVSRVDAELASVGDVRFANAVANNQMYDRFATRDAAVLQAMLTMIDMDLLKLRDDSEFDDINTPLNVKVI